MVGMGFPRGRALNKDNLTTEESKGRQTAELFMIAMKASLTSPPSDIPMDLHVDVFLRALHNQFYQFPRLTELKSIGDLSRQKKVNGIFLDISGKKSAKQLNTRMDSEFAKSTSILFFFFCTWIKDAFTRKDILPLLHPWLTIAP